MASRKRSEATERAYKAYAGRDWVTCAKEAQAALNENPEDVEAQHALGVCALYRGEYGVALSCVRHALALDPELQSAWVTLGIIWKKLMKYGPAQEAWGRALELNPGDAVTMANMSTLFANSGRPEIAEKWCRKSLEVDPGMSEALRNLAFALLEQGKWREGWKCYESRVVNHLGPVIRNYTHRGQTPMWDGSAGKHVVFYGEQGVGDELMFASMLPDAIARCASVVLDCHPRLVDTFKRSFPGVTVFGTRKDPATEWARDRQIDAACALGSLGLFFRNETSEFPGTPYIVPDMTVAQKHRTGGRLRVGISWAGGTPETYRQYRTIPLGKWAPILKQDADFYSFQYEADSARQVAILQDETGLRIIHRPGLVEAKNYDETINFAASMDLIITVCGTLFHVGGSMGIPTWCLVPDKPAWRYGHAGETSFWYGSARMYRSTGPWEPVIERVASDLKQRIGASWKSAAE